MRIFSPSRSRIVFALAIAACVGTLTVAQAPALAQSPDIHHSAPAGATAAPGYSLAEGVEEHGPAANLYRAYVRTFDARDFDPFLALFAEDAAYLRPTDKLYLGRGEIAQVYREAFARSEANGAHTRTSFHVVQRKITPTMVSDVGFSTVELQRADQAPITIRLQIAMLFHRTSAGWRLQVQSYSTYKEPA